MDRGAKIPRQAAQPGGEIKIVLTLDTVEHRRRVERLAFYGVENIHPGHKGSPGQRFKTAYLTGVPK